MTSRFEGHTIPELFEWSTRYSRDKTAITFHGEAWSYGRVADESHRIANALTAWGLQRGDRAAILSLNTPEYLTAYFGALGAGLAITPVGVRLPSGDHAFLINDAEARILFFHFDLLAWVEGARAELPSVERYVAFRAGDGTLPDWAIRYEDVIASASSAVPDVGITGQDICKIMYTGGTTGRPRGVVQIHDQWTRSMLSAVMNLELSRNEVTLAPGPLSHGTLTMVLPTFLVGGCVAVMREFDPAYLLRLIEEQRVTLMPVFPSMVYMLLEMEQAHRTDFSSLRHALCAGSPMSPDRLEEAIKVFGDVFHQGYGQTEALVITWLHPQEQSLETPEGRRRIASCGKPVLGVHIRLLDDSGSDVPDGEVGEICVRSPCTMREYWRRPDDTAKAFEGGWLHTGDMGRVDENGYYYIVDRKKDMIITGAYNVYSQEIEDVLTEHPAIAEAAVIGVPDAKWGEAVKACVVLHRGAEVDAQEIIAFVRERKGPVQAPKSVEFLDYMPLTQALKADKKLLRARYWEGQGRQVH